MNKQKKEIKETKERKCCRVGAVVSIDERGQILLPKDLRAKADLNPGDKLAVVTAEDRGDICCIYLIRTDKLAEMVKDILGPVMKDLI